MTKLVLFVAGVCPPYVCVCWGLSVMLQDAS